MRLIDCDNRITCCDGVSEEFDKGNDPEECKNHQPMIHKIGNFVTIHVDNHPMLDVHHILFIFLETNQGFQFKDVSRELVAKADFILAKAEEIVDVNVFSTFTFYGA